MKLKIVILTFAVFLEAVTAKIDPQNLRCLVCRTTFQELNHVIKNVERWKKVDVGNFRMDASGNTMQQKVPAHRSAVYISEVIDGICKKMDDYVRVYYKATGKLAIMQLMTEGGMNPDFSKAKFVTDDDLNKSLEYYCERMFEDNEEEITDLYKNRPEDDVMPDAEREICFDHAKYCEEWMLPTEEDTTWTPEMEAEYVKVHGPDPYGFGGPAGLPQQTFAGDVSDEGYDDNDGEDTEPSEVKDEL
ncbi:canopy-1 like protein [Danaus plexippus plexippus]|uniref:Canopy-1 like protein n=1 Tax=Danaus plexippus plexippus TaxID=278856 RepID=A0A212ETX8_DANPL|nr:protein seele-like [Danaus plexippus plexippus]OWR44955.1 canopy-1 like protein [Danaus plexippus plexippus]